MFLHKSFNLQACNHYAINDLLVNNNNNNNNIRDEGIPDVVDEGSVAAAGVLDEEPTSLVAQCGVASIREDVKQYNLIR